MYHLSQTSESRFEGVHPELVRCVRRAIAMTTQDFGVFEGLRTASRQQELYAAGVSRTLNSYHLTGDAIDLVPYIGGRLQWQQPACEQVAIAMREASIYFGVRVTWGGVWDMPLSALDPRDMAAEVHGYILRYRLANPGKSPLIDGPHFQRAR